MMKKSRRIENYIIFASEIGVIVILVLLIILEHIKNVS